MISLFLFNERIIGIKNFHCTKIKKLIYGLGVLLRVKCLAFERLWIQSLSKKKKKKRKKKF
jgi:hypothetical protein